MLIKKNIGIYLDRDEFIPIKSEAIGDYWGPDCQGVLRNVAGEKCTRFFAERRVETRMASTVQHAARSAWGRLTKRYGRTRQSADERD